MKILCISNWGFFGDMAMRMALEGHDVKLHVYQPEYKDIFDGISCGGKLEKVKDWQKWIKWCDFCILDDSSYATKDKHANIQKVLLSAGVPTFGMGNSKTGKVILGGKEIGSAKFAESFENDRHGTHELFKKLVIGKPYPTQSFKDVDDAIEFLKSNTNKKYVVKPELGDAEKSYTMVGELDNNEDLIKFLKELPNKADVKNINSVELEEKQEGIEVGVSAWFNGNKFLQPICINFEHKKFKEGDKGFNTGEMGTSMCYVDDPENPIFKLMLKLVPTLQAVDYRGELDLNCIINDSGDIYVLEPTPRIGVPAGWIESSLHGNNNADLFHALATGKDYTLNSQGWATGVVLCSIGYPWQKEATERANGVLVKGILEKGVPTDIFEDAHIAECKLDKELDLVVCDDNSGYIGCAVGVGNTLMESIKDVYDNVLPEIKSPGLFYREDIGNRVIPQIPKLEKLGFKFK